MSAQVYVHEPSICLMTALIRHLEERPASSLQKTVILLPTQRLATYLLAGLLQRHRALRPPSLMTLENLLNQLAPSDQRLIGDSAVDLLLSRLIAEGHYTHLRSGHERELRLLHGELFDHGLRDQAFTALKDAIRDDIYKSETHLGSLYDRAIEIEHILALLDMQLEQRGLITRAARLARSAQNLASRWTADPFPAEQYVLAGYTSLASSWQSLLDTWLGDERFTFWLSDAPRLYHPSSPLKELLAKIEARVPVTRVAASSQPTQRWIAAAAPTYVDEVGATLEGVEQLLVQGFSPEKIGILVTDERNYAIPLTSALEHRGLTANIALARPWASSLPGRALQAVEQLWEEQESIQSVLACLNQPLIRRALAYQQGWQEPEADIRLADLQEQLLRTGIPRSIERMLQDLPPSAQEPLSLLRELLRPLHPHTAQSLDAWLTCLEDWTEQLAFWQSGEERDVLQSCREAFIQFTSTLRLLGETGHALDSRSFWELVRRHLLETDIRRTGEPLAGLQVLIVTEARYVPFQAAFLLGCHEGSFPKALPQDELLDNYLKKAMGLPGWEVLESMEDQTFHLLKARLPHLMLLRSQRKGDVALVRSRFVESLLVREKGAERIFGSRSLLHGEQRVVVRAEDREGRLSTVAEPLFRTMSASRLEKLIRCPYAFLLDSLDVRAIDPPPPWGDPRREGEWLHGILEALISGQRAKRQLLPPWRPQSAETLAQEALERLHVLTHRLAPPELQASALMMHLLEHAWPRFAQFLAQLYGQQPAAVAMSLREYSLQQAKPVPPAIDMEGRCRQLVGRIDAIDPVGSFAVVTDYKRRTLPGGRDTRHGFAPQLAFYALALEQGQQSGIPRGLLLGYWNIYKGYWEAHAISSTARAVAESLGLCKPETPDSDALKAGLLRLWAWREHHIEQIGRFYADPSRCELCSFAGICRKEDPQQRPLLAEQRFLEQFHQESLAHES